MACQAPSSALSHWWEYGGDISWIEVRFSAERGVGTRIEIEHIMRVDEKWREFGPGAVGVGWDMGLRGLARHLASGKAVDPRESAAWSASDHGKGFMSLSSRRWYEANVAAGADQAEAQAGADRTAAAYTGISLEGSTAT